MDRKRRYFIWIYIAGAFITALSGVQSIYQNGGFQRHHAATELLITAILFSISVALWPILIVIAILQFCGMLPHLITLSLPQ
jgi:hypothetical protein